MAEPTALSLVHEGWNHLRLQRPLAAWASWQRALRLSTDDPAAREALRTLENAAELPAAARASYRFVQPAGEERRARWDARLRAAGGLDDLGAAASAFAAIAADDPDDADARLNLALCLAWLGQNAESVAVLDDVVALRAGADPDRAADAATLAEVLRLGAGAEELADDLRYVWTTTGPAPAGLLDAWPNLHPVAMPDDPLGGGKALDAGRVFEWRDRPDRGPVTEARDLPRVLATVIDAPGFLRLSTPDAGGLDRLDDPDFDAAARAFASARREATPLPIPWADAALGTFRVPPGLDPEARTDLARGAVEHYFEDLWVHAPRHALGGRTPLETARAAAAGDADARARLAGVVRFREQLGARPSHAGLYLGYPFDRLRRRLGLLGAGDSPAYAPDDASCMSEAELDALDPAALGDVPLADAFLSSQPLGSDPRAARFAAAMLERGSPSLALVDLESLAAPLVREALRVHDPDRALAVLARAEALSTDIQVKRTLGVWAAEVLARSGRGGEARGRYEALVASAPSESAAAVALDGAETLLDNGEDDDALPLLRDAHARAAETGQSGTRDRAAVLIDRLGG